MLISFVKKQVYPQDKQKAVIMSEKKKYYVVTGKAVPEVLLKVVEAKKLLDAEKVLTVQEATDQVGISRSSFYKYKDDIFPFHEKEKGRTITLVIRLEDEPGLLSAVLKTIADFHANILTIHQSIPVNGCAAEPMPAKSALFRSMSAVRR